MLVRRAEVRRPLVRPALRWAVDRLDRLCVVERLELRDRLVDPDRAALERFALELDRAERPPLLPRRCASAIVGRLRLAA